MWQAGRCGVLLRKDGEELDRLAPDSYLHMLQIEGPRSVASALAPLPSLVKSLETWPSSSEAETVVKVSSKLAIEPLNATPPLKSAVLEIASTMWLKT